MKLVKRIISTDYVDLIPGIEMDNPSPLEGGHPRRGQKAAISQTPLSYSSYHS